jgi:hypothetical protein
MNTNVALDALYGPLIPHMMTASVHRTFVNVFNPLKPTGNFTYRQV